MCDDIGMIFDPLRRFASRKARTDERADGFYLSFGE